MTGGGIGGQGPIVVALMLEDGELADRLATILADLPALRLAAPGERAHLALVDPALVDPALANPDAVAGPTQPCPALTPREIEVLLLLAEGASNKTIARRLGISVHTAKFHVGRLLDKLDASGRTDAVAHAARLGVLRL